MSDTVLVTGASGFIAKHIIALLLSHGFNVRGTLRNVQAGDAVRRAVLPDDSDPAALTFATADLGREDDWRAACAGCRHVVHVASPFPLKQPKDRAALVPIARGGALNVIRAAISAGAERVVMTSSMVAMMYRSDRRADRVVRESDWTDPDWHSLTPYIVSKTLAEKAAWQEVERDSKRSMLVTINPGFVLGPPRDTHTSTSVAAFAMILKGAYPAVPPVAFPVVDVRDLASVHVSALTAPVAGRRLIAAGETLSMKEMALELHALFPQRARRIPTAELSPTLARTIALFDANLRALNADFGVRPIADASETTRSTGLAFRSARETLKDTADALIRLGLA